MPPPPTPRNRGKRRSPRPRLRGIPRILVLVETSRAYGRGIVEGIARYARENGPWSIQFEERGLESSPPEWLKEWRGEGIIVRTINWKLEKLLRATNLPLVELHGDPKIGVAQVRTDGMVGGRMVVEHFLNCGLRHFAFFAYGEAWFIKTHRETFCKALEEKGYECHIYHSASSERIMPVWHERQRPRLIRWLRTLPRPIGIYCAGDLHAARLLDVCRDLNIAVPEEMAVMGVGNDPVICDSVFPTLSSLDLDARRVGYKAASLLDQKMTGKEPKDTIYVPPSQVVVRQSTDLMVIEDADVAHAMRFIREYACAGIDVPRVAEEVGVSESVLERRFRQYLERSPKAEIMRIRIERSKMLLAETDKNSKRIAHQCGFNSLAYFTYAFRSKVGMTPNAYRRMRRVSRDSDKREL
jgi:LacI family transcriptional regulator